MQIKLNHIILILLVCSFFAQTSCHVEKRLYNKGWYISQPTHARTSGNDVSNENLPLDKIGSKKVADSVAVFDEAELNESQNAKQDILSPVEEVFSDRESNAIVKVKINTISDHEDVPKFFTKRFEKINSKPNQSPNNDDFVIRMLFILFIIPSPFVILSILFAFIFFKIEKRQALLILLSFALFIGSIVLIFAIALGHIALALSAGAIMALIWLLMALFIACYIFYVTHYIRAIRNSPFRFVRKKMRENSVNE